ncbi:MAG: CorA family divalent cation transporter [Thermoproteota archaeon]
MQNVISYNEREVRRGGSKEDIRQGYNVWVDLSDPTPAELWKAQQSFHLDSKALEEYSNKSKRPQVRMLESHVFTLMLDMRYGDAQTLVTEGIYIFLGRGWLVTIHSSEVDLMAIVKRILEEKNRPLIESSVDALYYSVLSSIVDKYEQLLTAIELSMLEMEQLSVHRRPSKQMLEHLDNLSRQMIVLRRHFWRIRDVINFLIHVQEERPDIKYLKIVYDDINQLIELVESYQDTVNSTRELYIANVSLLMNDTVKTLTVFSAVLLPLTFISSVFGMNGLDLNNIWNVPFGFVVITGVMAVAAVALLLFLKAKQWILVGEDAKQARKEGHDKSMQH